MAGKLEGVIKSAARQPEVSGLTALTKEADAPNPQEAEMDIPAHAKSDAMALAVCLVAILILVAERIL